MLSKTRDDGQIDTADDTSIDGDRHDPDAVPMIQSHDSEPVRWHKGLIENVLDLSGSGSLSRQSSSGLVQDKTDGLLLRRMLMQIFSVPACQEHGHQMAVGLVNPGSCNLEKWSEILLLQKEKDRELVSSKVEEWRTNLLLQKEKDHKLVLSDLEEWGAILLLEKKKDQEGVWEKLTGNQEALVNHVSQDISTLKLSIDKDKLILDERQRNHINELEARQLSDLNLLEGQREKDTHNLKDVLLYDETILKEYLAHDEREQLRMKQEEEEKQREEEEEEKKHGC